MHTHNLCFEQKYEKYQKLLSKKFHFLVVKFSVYLNRLVFIMILKNQHYANYPKYSVTLTYLSLASHKRDIGKQCRPRSDASECGV